MRLALACLVVLAACGERPPGPARTPAPAPASTTVKTGTPASLAAPIEPQALRADVEHLASPAMRGRGTGTPENEAAARWIAGRLQAIGLEPLTGEQWLHEFRMGALACRNVAGIVRAPGADEYVVVGCHHDHLGVRGKAVFAGADDNASGVAAMLALAAACVAERTSLRRHVVFVSFDAEERGLIGSKRFVDADVVPREKTRFMMVFDLIGGTFLPGEEEAFYAFGSEHSRAVRQVLAARAPGRTVTARLLSTYLLEPAGPVFARSDYAAYRRIGVPYLFFTTGTPWYYHKPEDVPERLDYAKMAGVVGVARDVLLDVARDTAPLDFVASPATEPADLEAVATMAERLHGQRQELKLGEELARALETQAADLRRVLVDGKLDDRARRLAQRTVVNLLAVAGRRPR
jgi:hypothetical protein